MRENVFINHSCTFMDRGGITIEDDVLIGPKVNLITTGHPISPAITKATKDVPANNIVAGVPDKVIKTVM